MKIEVKKQTKFFSSREKARLIFSRTKTEDEEIDLDFAGVQTITPSFIHEMFSTILENNKHIKIINILSVVDSVKLQIEKSIAAIRKDFGNTTFFFK